MILFSIGMKGIWEGVVQYKKFLKIWLNGLFLVILDERGGFKQVELFFQKILLRMSSREALVRTQVCKIACLSCLLALRAYVPACLKLLRALNYYVPTCLTCPHFSRAYVPTCQRAFASLYIFHGCVSWCLKLFS